MELVDIETLPQLTRDLRKASGTLSPGEARTLVDLYYQLQIFRIQAGNQNTALAKAEEPHETIGWFNEQFHQLEKDIGKALDAYSAAQEIGAWARQHVGVGPVIAAGLLAHIDISQSPTPSSLWKFAGLAPGQRYERGVKRDWNARLKVLCWKMGESFVKNSGRDNCYYGKLYRERKKFEVDRNNAVWEVPRHAVSEQGTIYTTDGLVVRCAQIEGHWFVQGNAQAALEALTTKNIRDADYRATLLSGKLPDGQLDMRARRYAVKRFLVHYWQAGYWLHYGTEPPRAYVLEHMPQHTHEEPCPIPFPKAAQGKE